MAATILLPAGFGALHAERLLLAEADGAEAVGRDAQRDEILLDGTGAAITEAEVIFGRTTLIAMTFDGYLTLDCSSGSRRSSRGPCEHRDECQPCHSRN